MSKYSLETKIKAVHDVLKLGMSLNAVAKLLPNANAVIQRWVARYEELEINGLSMKAQTYSSDFNVHVVEYIHENSISLFRGAAHLVIPSDLTIGNWECIYYEEGPEALYKNNRGRKQKMTKDNIRNE
jgi:transposase